ncbi:MAG: 5-Nucleotidase domain protein [Rhizobium sp.]|nr:5-Nucleotidase domain protein [Rhizobium sp.]
MTTFTDPVTVTGDSTYTLAAGDILDVTGDAALIWEGTDTNDTINNAGLITGSSDNSLVIGTTPVTGTLAFNNLAGATVASEMDLRDLTAGATVTITNAGLFNAVSSHAMRFAEDGGSVILNNEATGVITAADASEDVLKDGSNTTINNYGKIISSGDEFDAFGLPSQTGGDAIDFGEGTNNLVHNFAGGIIAASHHGVTSDFGATVINDAGAQIIGHNGAGLNFDNAADGDTLADLQDKILIVTNHGTILGESQTYEDSDGDAIDTDGLVDVDNYGFIGGLGANGEHDGGTNHSEALAIGGGTVNNFAGGSIYSVQRGIQVDDSAEGPALAATTIMNAGTIQASGGWEAIQIVGDQNDTLTNSGTIIGDILMGGGTDKVTLKTGSNIVGEIHLGEGNDTIKGSAGSELIYGDAGKDNLTGGAGADTFFFAEGDSGKTKTAADTIFDFTKSDTIDLTGFDANTTKNGDQDFTFIGDDAFHNKAGELRFVEEKSDTYIYGDTNGDGKADFAIHLDDAVSLKAGYFDL